MRICGGLVVGFLQKIAENEYYTFEEFVEDVRLLFSNSRTYWSSEEVEIRDLELVETMNNIEMELERFIEEVRRSSVRQIIQFFLASPQLLTHGFHHSLYRVFSWRRASPSQPPPKRVALVCLSQAPALVRPAAPLLSPWMQTLPSWACWDRLKKLMNPGRTPSEFGASSLPSAAAIILSLPVFVCWRRPGVPVTKQSSDLCFFFFVQAQTKRVAD